jgi:ABC-type transport system involved in cytochrome bd biosynthesis fused ATPase/permease subunit
MIGLSFIDMVSTLVGVIMFGLMLFVVGAIFYSIVYDFYKEVKEARRRRREAAEFIEVVHGDPITANQIRKGRHWKWYE